nr:hypothetical protein StreXyl84_30800 [Streptomyces sp. Xyl84]
MRLRRARFEQLLQVLHPEVEFTVHIPNGTFVKLGAPEVPARARVAGGAARGQAAIVGGRSGVVSWNEDGAPLALLVLTVADGGRITEITAVAGPAALALVDLPDPVRLPAGEGPAYAKRSRNGLGRASDRSTFCRPLRGPGESSVGRWRAPRRGSHLVRPGRRARRMRRSVCPGGPDLCRRPQRGGPAKAHTES